MIFNIKLIKILTLFFFISSSFISSSYTDSELSKNHVNQLGSDTAENLLIEYASMSCVHCANFHNNEFPKIKKIL